MKLRSWALCLCLASCGPLATLAVPGCVSRAAVPVWNLPTLIGQPIDAAQKSLGPPQREEAVSPGVQRSVWERDGVTLSANWKSSSKRVIAYELVSRDESRALREGETDPLLVPGQLKPADPAYSLEWIEAPGRALHYIGVRVVPAPKTHPVLLRVTGPEGLVQVAYQATSTGGKSDTFITIPPWEASFTLADDATLSVSASLVRNISGGSGAMKAEILVDGKVVADASSPSGVVSCKYEL